MTEPAPIGTVHDLGYRRYAGALRSRSALWRVIARHQIAMAWKTFWRFKLALFVAVATTIAFTLIMTRAGEFGGAAGLDNILVISFDFYVRAAWLASMTIGAMVIASDTQSGAFGFYFARPVRAVDYVLGKVAAMFFLMATLTVVGPVILVGVRLALYDDASQAIERLYILPQIAGVGALTALAYAVVPLAFSSLVASRRHALALWVAHYVVVGSIALLIGRTGSSVAALDLLACAKSAAYGVLDVTRWRSRWFTLDVTTATASLAIQSAVAIAVVMVRVRSARAGGVVSAS